MEFTVIGDEEIVLGFRFVGVPGIAVSSRDEALAAFSKATQPGDSLILILTEQVSAMLAEEVMNQQMSGSYPLIVEIPGIEGHLENRKSLVDSIREAIGIHV